MSDGTAERIGTDTLCELLAATRDALTSLRADELEDLAVRAERGMGTIVWPHPTPLKLRSDIEIERMETREHRLLGDLLRATESNLEVLRRVRVRAITGEELERWER